MEVLLPNNLWLLCPGPASVTLTNANDTLDAGDFPVKKVVLCPALTVSISTSLLRRCFNNNYYHVSFCNEGTAPALGAYVDVELDVFLLFISATVPHQDLGSNVYRFFVGDLGIGACGNFKIRVAVDCGSALGQTHCTRVHIYPNDLCNSNQQWSGASLDLRGVCETDSMRFIIKNVGGGNMTSAVDYIVVEDAVMIMQSMVPLLDSGDSVSIAYPANGSTWYVQVGQENLHPYPGPRSLSVEGCTTNASFSTGFVNQFPQSSPEPFMDEDCTENIGSFDPNDKRGFPDGYGMEHYVWPGTELDYLIRFQNTGTDTAFNIVILDTLSKWFDPASIKFGASSHPYRYDLTGEGVAHFIFENILLPDSNINEPASHGFVRFSIKPRPEMPLETLVENTAAIYFDFNEPIFTNTTFHRFGENFIKVGLWQPEVPEARVLVVPNPFATETVLTVDGLDDLRGLRLQVFDLFGKEVRSQEAEGANFHLKRGNWPSGLYLFRITRNGELVGSGKLNAE
jgi:hypothetical protein